jgi:alanyl-tRNA synthetase
MHKYHNAFLFESKEKIKNVEKKDFFLIELEDTIFYPGGGGQPCDLGKISSKDFLGDVVEVYKEQDKIIHKVKGKGNLKENDEVSLNVDSDRRVKIVKMHTGEHIFYKSLEKTVKDLKLKKIELGIEESSIFVDAKDLTWDKVLQGERLANEIISKDLDVVQHLLTREEAIKLGKLRIKPERIKSDTIRVVEVKDFDWSACAGIHAEKTGIVSNILITKFGLEKGGYEIRFKVDVKEDLFNLAESARKIASFLETDQDSALDKLKKIVEEKEEYKEKFRELSTKLLDYSKQEKVNEITLIHNSVENIEKKQLIDKANELLKEKTIVCFVNKNKRATILLSISQDLDYDAPALLNKVLSKFKGKGGGRDKFAMGSVELKYSDKIIDELKKYI